MTSNRKLRIGAIGVGGISEAVHLPCWKQLPDAEIVALADIDQARLHRVGDRFGVSQVFTDFGEMLKEVSLDAVDICTPNRVHTPAVLAALEAGCHVLCEKPLAVTGQEVRQMGELADAKGLILMTGHHHRFGEPALAIRDWIDAGGLGDVYHARVRALRRSWLPAAPGFIDAALSGGGPCMDIGVHALDLALWFMGFPRPVRVTGSARVNFARGHAIPGQWGEWDRNRFSVEDFAAGFVHFENGATLVLESSWLGHQTLPEELDCQLYGTQGGVTWPSCAYATVHGRTFARGTLESPQRVEKPLWDELRAFAQCVREATPSPVPWRQSIIAIQILEAIYLSQKRGAEIRLDS